MPVTKETYSNQNFYGKWLPVPVIDRIVVTDNKITPHISINLKAFKGEVLFVMGSNGSGKSTLLKTLSNLI